MTSTKEQLERLEQEQASREENRRNLYWAMRTRVLTTEEMAEVERLDYQLLIPVERPGQWVTYNEKDKRDEFNSALLQQFKLRLAAQQVSGA